MKVYQGILDGNTVPFTRVPSALLQDVVDASDDALMFACRHGEGDHNGSAGPIEFRAQATIILNARARGRVFE